MSPKLKGDERDRIADDGRGGDRAARRSRAADIAMRELRHFGTVFLYLALVLGVFALHQFVVLANNGMAYTFCGASLINAAILAKIMHVAEAFHFGEHGLVFSAFESNSSLPRHDREALQFRQG